jgi:hypothetical protein
MREVPFHLVDGMHPAVSSKRIQAMAPTYEQLQAEVLSLRAQLGEQRTTIAQLEMQVQWLRKQLFGGTRSDGARQRGDGHTAGVGPPGPSGAGARASGQRGEHKVNRDQLLLELDQAEAALEQARRVQQVSYEREVTPASTAAARGRAAEAIDHLPVQETVVIEPAEVKAEPQAYEKIGEEVTHDAARQRGEGGAASTGPNGPSRTGARASGQ